MKYKAILFAAASVLAVAAPAAADSVCSGPVATVRVSKLTPNGTLAGFEKAVSDHQAWYKSHGDATQIVFAKSEGKLISVTFHPDQNAKMPDIDDAYKAFRDEYSANSEIEVSGTACLTNAEALYKKQHQ